MFTTGANRIPSEWHSACGKADSTSSEDGTAGDLNEETETDSAVESDNQSTNDNERDSEPKKPKRTRTAYSNYQLDQLELVFSSTHYPDVFTREELARRLGIREDRIQVCCISSDGKHRCVCVCCIYAVALGHRSCTLSIEHMKA